MEGFRLRPRPSPLKRGIPMFGHLLFPGGSDAVEVEGEREEHFSSLDLRNGGGGEG